jgi:AraC family transcriptional regulator
MDDAAHLADTDPLERARAFADASAAENPSLEALARVAGLSPYHFVRAFSARFGASPVAYVRERRMALAARRLADGDAPPLVELAFDMGFESQEGFTRAFKRAHGVSPGRYRRSPQTLESPMSVATAHLRLTMSQAPVRKAGFRVAGVHGVFDEATRSKIPVMWPSLIQRLPLPGQVGDDASFGVCWAADGANGAFNYMAAVPIAADAPAPEGLMVRDVPEQSYLVFRQEIEAAELQPQMVAAMREIWGERVPASGFKLANGPDLEAYPPEFEPGRATWLEWWIPVEA